MNISVNTSALAKKLRHVAEIVAQKSIVPIMSNVLMSAADGELTLATTNIENSLMTTCPVVVNEKGSITAPVKSLLDIVNEISEESTHFIYDKKHLRIAAGAFKMRLQTLPPEDFPTMPDMPEGGLLLPGDLFKTMVKRVRYAISDSDKRYFMAGAMLSLTDSTIALVATDGKRLALTATKRNTAGKNLEVVIPTKTLDVLLADSDTHDDLLFNQDMRQMFFASDDHVLASRMIDGKFPDYKRIIPKHNTDIAVIPRLPLLSALKRVSLAAGESRVLTLHLETDSLSLASADASVGDAVEYLPIQYTGPTQKIAFEWQFIADFLNAAQAQHVKLALGKPTDASLWSDGDGAELMNVIMRVKV